MVSFRAKRCMRADQGWVHVGKEGAQHAATSEANTVAASTFSRLETFVFLKGTNFMCV